MATAAQIKARSRFAHASKATRRKWAQKAARTRAANPICRDLGPHATFAPHESICENPEFSYIGRGGKRSRPVRSWGTLGNIYPKKPGQHLDIVGVDAHGYESNLRGIASANIYDVSPHRPSSMKSNPGAYGRMALTEAAQRKAIEVGGISAADESGQYAFASGMLGAGLADCLSGRASKKEILKRFNPGGSTMSMPSAENPFGSELLIVGGNPRKRRKSRKGRRKASSRRRRGGRRHAKRAKMISRGRKLKTWQQAVKRFGVGGAKKYRSKFGIKKKLTHKK